MSIGIVGHGMVGSALRSHLMERGETVLVHDIGLPGSELHHILKTHVCFLCLPTLPPEDGGGVFDLKALQETLRFLQDNHYCYPVILKSTLLPGTTDRFQSLFPALHLCHCPEFLSERTRVHDTRHPPQILVGLPLNAAASLTGMLHNFFQVHFPFTPLTLVDASTTECCKIYLNSFYCVKLHFFNDLYETCQRMGYNYAMIRHCMLLTGWINPMHTRVPGAEGKLGFGGRCLPKDLAALTTWCHEKECPGQLLEVVSIRNEERVNEKGENLA